MKVVIPFLLFVIVIACTAPQEKPQVAVSSGRVIRLDSFPSSFVAPRNVDIWVPEDFSTATTYNVLYMHDGQMLYDASTTWNKQEWGVDEVAAKLIESGAVDPFIVVGVWNSGRTRHSDYFPQKPFEALPTDFRDSLLREVRRDAGSALFAAEVQSDKYLKFLVQELKPYIDQQYPTFSGRDHTFIAGSSMGGLISMYAICEYPEVFGGAACLSTHWPGVFTIENNPIPGAFRDYLAQNLPNPETHRIYFDFGTATLDALYEPCQLPIDSVMVNGGYTEANWITRKFEGADHSEQAWRSRLDIPLTFLMKSR